MEIRRRPIAKLDIRDLVNSRQQKRGKLYNLRIVSDYQRGRGISYVWTFGVATDHHGVEDQASE